MPGVGARIRDRFIDHFGSEKAALDAVRRGNVADLLEVVSERQAISLVQWMRGMKYGAEPEDIQDGELCPYRIRSIESRHYFSIVFSRDDHGESKADQGLCKLGKDAGK
jgi:hypothetical protein